MSCQLCCAPVGMLPLSNQRWLTPGASLSFQVLRSWIDTNSPTQFVHARDRTLQLCRRKRAYLYSTLCVPHCPLAAGCSVLLSLYHVSALKTVCARLRWCHPERKFCTWLRFVEGVMVCKYQHASTARWLLIKETLPGTSPRLEVLEMIKY